MQDDKYAENNKRIAKNTLLLYFRMLFTMGVSLYTSRLVLSILGVSDFGIYNIVGGIVALFSFFSASMQSATQRYLSYTLGQKDYIKYRKYFSANIVIYISIAIIIVILAQTIGIWFIENRLNIPEYRLEISIIVFQISIVTTCFGLIRIPYQAGIISEEKMSFFAYVSILDILLKLLIIIALTNIQYDKLLLYSILILLITIFINIVYILYCQKNKKLYKIMICRDKVIYNDLIHFSSWRLLGATSQIAEIHGVNIFFNIFYGTIINAANGIATQVSGAVNSLVYSFQQSFQPQITKYYATQDFENMQKLVKKTAKFSFILLTFFIIPLELNMEFILNIWLENPPQYATIFCQLILIYTLLEALNAPLWMVIISTGRIALYQFFLAILTLLSFIMAYLLLYYGYAPQYVLIARIIIIFIILLYRLYLLRYFYNIKVNQFLIKSCFVPMALFIMALFLIYYITISLTYWCKLIVTISLTCSIYPIAIYYICLDKKEKSFSLNILKNITKYGRNNKGSIED
jgi:O-antigen/teichoic acid export membrane protein